MLSMNLNKTLFPTILVFLIFGVAGSLQAQSPVTISLDASQPGTVLAPDFSGLSFEVSQLLPNANGIHYFRPDNTTLIRLFHTLGIKNLRIGGNTSDRDVRRLPENADLDSLFAFAKVAGVKIIYCLRLHNGDPQADVRVAKYIMDRYAGEMDCFSIGQEPSAYPVEKVDHRPGSERMGAGAEKYRYEDYRDAWKQFAAALIAAVPDIQFCGPSVHNNGKWADQFMADFGHGHHVVLITEHLYPGGAGGKVPTPEIGRDRMLSERFVNAYEKLYNGFGGTAISNGLPYRLEEVNNYFNGGATNVSNTFASALWGLDFMCWWAAHGAAGLNFHTGDKVAAGYTLQPSKYTAYYTTTNGYLIRPLGYGIKAFDLGGHGRLVPVTISNTDQLNLSAYAMQAGAKDFFVTLINKEHGPQPKIANVLITGPAFTGAKIISLRAPDNDLADTSGVKLGGAMIENDGSWNGKWMDLPVNPNGQFTVTVPPASASIIRLTEK
jgi:hypothetical protein